MPRTRRARRLVLGLYADAEDLAWAGRVVEGAAVSRGARIVERTLVRACPDYEDLAEQWAWEHPGEDPGPREPVELRLRLACSLRVWRAVRKAALAGLCPAGAGPHVCRVPWSA